VTQGARVSPALVVGAAVVDDLARPRRLLAARRTRPAQLAGRWELPGGKVEPGERPEQALHRELREELGVGVDLGAELIGPDDGRWPISAQLEMRVWLAELADGEPTPDGAHDEVRWLDHGSWIELDWLPADVPVVARLAELSR
jgi:8-oxo-dGTP diphosphatase